MNEEIENALHAAEAMVETLKAEVAAAPVAAEAAPIAPPEESGSQYLGHIGEPRIEGKDY